MGQKFAAYSTQGAIIGFYDSIDSPVPASVTSAIPITDVQWQACLATPGYTIVNGALVPPAPPTAAQVQAIQFAGFEQAVQVALDTFARTWGYTSIVSAASYAASTVAQYKAEATALITWRDAMWQAVASTEAAITAGTTPAPTTPAAFVALMPAAPARPTA
jgi:hypothetical protein